MMKRFEFTEEHPKGRMVEVPEEEIQTQKTEYEQELQQLSYEQLVETFIRERYTVSDELAILRQRDTKTEEFSEYNLFCEECKARAKEIKAVE